MGLSIDLKIKHPISWRFILKKTFVWFLFGILFLLGSFFILSKGGDYSIPISNINLTTFALFNLLGFSIFIIKVIYTTLYRYTLKYRIEDESFMMSKGVIIRQQAVIPFIHITDIFIKRDLLDFIFGLWTIEVSSTSDYKEEFAIIEGFSKKEADGMRRSMRKAHAELANE